MYLDDGVVEDFEAEAVRLGVLDPHITVIHSEGGMRDSVKLNSGSNLVCSGQLSWFPGCCGIAILHDATHSSSAPKGVPELMFRIREAMALDSDKGLCVYTDVLGAHPEFLRRLGYRLQTRGFYNPNSGNRVNVWAKRIGQEE